MVEFSKTDKIIVIILKSMQWRAARWRGVIEGNHIVHFNRYIYVSNIQKLTIHNSRHLMDGWFHSLFFVYIYSGPRDVVNREMAPRQK